MAGIGKVMDEVKKAVVGKDAVLLRAVLAILAGGHILLEDVPGVGKTTMALAFSKALGLRYNRMQFTPDVLLRCDGFLSLQQSCGENGIPARRRAVQPVPGR